MDQKYYLGHPEQTAGAELFRREGGRGDGTRVCRIRNGLGLECMIAPDRAADVTELTFCGQNMGFLSPCGPAGPDKNAPFLDVFTAGFFTTCGLDNVGSPNVDEGENLTLHGTISNTPCHNFYAVKEEGGIRVCALLYDGRLFGRNLKMEREYFFPADENAMLLTDKITNFGEAEAPVEILYHCNMGYPLLDEDSVLKIPSERVTPRNGHAATGLRDWNKMQPPTAGYEEMCFFHELRGVARVAIEQPKLGLGLAMEYDVKALPYFTEWKMMGQRQYVLGLEPGNCHPDGRSVMREQGALSFLKPEETAEFRVKFIFYKTEE